MRLYGLASLVWTLGVSAGATEPPICSGTLTDCRPCTASDDGQPMGCDGATPLCETREPNPRFGYCVQCTTNENCTATTPICVAAGTTTDTCQACSSDTDCTSQLLGTYCLASGACSDVAPEVAPSNSSCSTGSGQASWLASIVLAFLLAWRRRPLPRTTFLAATELVSARFHASPSRRPASDAMRSAKRWP
jgi:MYXO-CTERM domain-containing protein